MRMKTLLVSGIVWAGSWMTLSAAPLSELAVHYAMKADKPPVIDGNLDDPSWKLAPEYARYRKGSGENHQNTGIRLLWDEKGLYIGIINYEANLDRLKTTVRTRDGGNIWADDSAEIYIDPSASGYSDYQFSINSIGRLGDYWQVDMGFTDWSWSASSAQAACEKGSASWNIEFFVSWSDLKKIPETGDVWMIFHRRLAYSSPNGSLTDSSTSGGSYGNRRFGYLFFCDSKIPSPEKIGDKLVKIATPPWVLPLNGKWLFADSKDSIVDMGPDMIIQKLREKAQAALDAIKDAGGEAEKEKIGLLNKRFAGADKLTAEFERMAEYKTIADEAAVLADEISLSEFIK